MIARFKAPVFIWAVTAAVAFAGSWAVAGYRLNALEKRADSYEVSNKDTSERTYQALTQMEGVKKELEAVNRNLDRIFRMLDRRERQ